jgi:plasmid stabilization system protein ParE
MRVELRIEARLDLVEAASFYDRQREKLGDYFLDRILSNLQTLEASAGVHELTFGFHRKLVDRFPFAIYYLVSESVVDVVAILDCRRDPEGISRRLGRTTR